MKKSTVILIWGGGTGIALVIFYQVLKATGQENTGLSWISLLLLFLGLFIGTRKYRDKANGGYLTFGQGFKAGFLMVLILTLLAIISTIVDMQLHPDFIDKILEQSRISMVNKGLTEQQIEAGMEMTKKFTTPVWIVIWIGVADLFFGAILSLITAGISTKAKPMFDETNETPNNETAN